MPNHVHVLLRLRPREQLATITRALKGKSARLSNVLLGRAGQRLVGVEEFIKRTSVVFAQRERRHGK
jgi:REP element-mobilizing transposase RayT